MVTDMQDAYNESYVLYRQLYGSYDFWIRPQQMFFENIADDGESKPRFCLDGETAEYSEKIKQLIQIVSNSEEPIRIRHSETLQEYTVFSIDTKSDDKVLIVSFAPKLFSNSSYFTDKELAYRLGYSLVKIDGNKEIKRIKLPLEEKYRLKVSLDKCSFTDLMEQFNPCSIDLHIADDWFLMTKRRTMDVLSVEHISSSRKYWRIVKTRKDGEIKLKPGQTVVTRIKELIRIPEDCAGKIEIKSTYARLSLSVTTGDFCNPGYYGHYPLVIRNDGNTSIILHSGEVMAQLMLIGLNSPVLSPYKFKATYRNSEGIDDGSPFSFFRERSLRKTKMLKGMGQVESIYNGILKQIDESTSDNKAKLKNRFEDTFCRFCSKRHAQGKYRSLDNNKPDLKKICKAYAKEEQFKKRAFNLAPLGGGAILGVISIITNMIVSGASKNNLWITGIIVIIVVVAYGLIHFLNPEVFCDNLDFDNVKDEENNPVFR